MSTIGRSEVARRIASEPRGHWLALLGVLLLGVAVRARLLGGPMRYDEAFTLLNYAGPPVTTLLSNYSAPNNHILHSLLVHASTALLGYDPPAVRLPAFVAGCALVPLTYAVGRRL